MPSPPGSSQQIPPRDSPLIVALGTSLGHRRQLLQQAVAALSQTPEILLTAWSNVYDTSPLGGVAEHRFLNAAVQLQTTLEPESLLDVLQSVETALGRTRTQHWEDRTMDLDLGLWGDRVIDTPRLVVPHPELHRRRFVLAPAVDLAPLARHPLRDQTLAQLLKALPSTPDECVPVRPPVDLRDPTIAPPT